MKTKLLRRICYQNMHKNTTERKWGQKIISTPCALLIDHVSLKKRTSCHPSIHVEIHFHGWTTHTDFIWIMIWFFLSLILSSSVECDVKLKRTQFGPLIQYIFFVSASTIKYTTFNHHHQYRAFNSSFTVNNNIYLNWNTTISIWNSEHDSVRKITSKF